MTLSNSKHIFILKNICHPRQTLFGLLLTILLVGALASPVLAGDLEKGEKTFIKCKVCHTVEKDVSKIGPSLYGVFGRKAGSLESFPNYSDSMKSADIIWDDKAIREFLKAPRTYIANTKMIFIGIKNDEEIDDLLAYLRSVSGAEAATETSDAEAATEGSGAEAAAETSDAEAAAETSGAEAATETSGAEAATETSDAETVAE